MMRTAELHFNGPVSRQAFLDNYWQKRPLLIRQAIDPACLRLDPGELAGLACEETVESRLIRQHGDTDWSLQHGPLDEADFAALPESHWTLLVQDVDKHLPEVGALLEAFDFLPDWRLDDIMISYATDQGGVGPHTDNYDVFLVQASGRRRWRLSYRDYRDSDLLADCPLRVLRDFDTHEDWVLEPGDLLYLPPRLAHWGTAIGECMTWSVGMRGASDTELAAAWLAHLADRNGRHHLRDHIDAATRNPSWLGPADIALACDHIRATQPQDSPDFRLWLGGYLTEPKPGFELPESEDIDIPALLRQWRQGRLTLHRHPWVRLALIDLDGQRLALCAQGEALVRPAAQRALLEAVCRHRRLAPDALAGGEPAQQEDLLSALLQRGWLCPEDGL